MHYKNILLVGDSGAGKTRSLRTLTRDRLKRYTLLNSRISIVRYVMDLEEEKDQIHFTFWDSIANIGSLNDRKFVPGNHIDCALLFLNLNQHKAYGTLDSWRKVIQKKRPDMDFMVVGTVQSESQKETEQARINKIKALEWCKENDDKNFIEIDVTDYHDVGQLYEDVARNLLISQE